MLFLSVTIKQVVVKWRHGLLGPGELSEEVGFPTFGKGVNGVILRHSNNVTGVQEIWNLKSTVSLKKRSVYRLTVLFFCYLIELWTPFNTFLKYNNNRYSLVL